MKRTKLRPVSPKRAKANREYLKRRAVYLKAHPYCQIWLKVKNADERLCIYRDGAVFLKDDMIVVRAPLSTEIHHSKKPKATYLNDESTWFAASRYWHNWVEEHKKEARELGLLQDNH